MEMVFSNGWMGALIPENLYLINVRDKANMSGLTEESLMDPGTRTRCKVKEPLPGQMEKNMRVNIKMTRKKDKVLFGGLMDKYMKDHLRMAKSMESEL